MQPATSEHLPNVKQQYDSSMKVDLNGNNVNSPPNSYISSTPPSTATPMNNMNNNNNISETNTITTTIELIEKEWNISGNPRALNTLNPIRRTVEGLNLQPNPDKSFIPLSIGDPTIYGEFKPCEEIRQAIVESIETGLYHGYQPSIGREDARKAIANYCARFGMNVNEKDIVIASGCSHALDLAIGTLAKPGGNILVPRPGFPLYATLSTLLDVNIRYYNLLPEAKWQIDLSDLESKIDANTCAIIYNNPSNPCGSVFPRAHILDFLAICERHRIPVIGDEIYEDIVFPGHEFHAVASLTDEVPVLHCSGTTKKFLIPGWRLGWVVINDKKDRFGADIRSALNSLSQRIIGANSLIQGALPKILQNTPKSFFDKTIRVIDKNASLAYERLREINGLVPVKPAGAFYIMVKIEVEKFPHFRDDLHFVESLVSEESVFCLPGGCFEYPGYVRLVLSIGNDVLDEALGRIKEFCARYIQDS